MENTRSHDPRSTYFLVEGKRPGEARIVNWGTVRDVKKNVIKYTGFLEEDTRIKEIAMGPAVSSRYTRKDDIPKKTTPKKSGFPTREEMEARRRCEARERLGC